MTAKTVNSDDAFEHLLKKAGLSMKMPESEQERRDVVRDRAKVVTDIKKGNYKIKVPHGLRMMPSNTTGIVNVFKEYDSNFGDCVLEVNITKIRGDVDLFVKRFNNIVKIIAKGIANKAVGKKPNVIP